MATTKLWKEMESNTNDTVCIYMENVKCNMVKSLRNSLNCKLCIMARTRDTLISINRNLELLSQIIRNKL